MHILERPVKNITKSPRRLLEQTQIDKAETKVDGSVNNPEKTWVMKICVNLVK